MSIESPNTLELKLIRESLRLSVSECAEIFKVSTRSWNHWESGRNKAPGQIVDEIDAFHSIRAQLVLDIYKDAEERGVDIQQKLPWYEDYQSFVSDYPKRATLVSWRIYQSVAVELMLFEGTLTLANEAVAIEPDSHLFKWLTKTTEIDLKKQDHERLFPFSTLAVDANPELSVLIMVHHNQLSVNELTEQQLIMASLAFDNPILLPSGRIGCMRSELLSCLSDEQKLALTAFKQ